ncbi:MAG TPA: glycosyltransferase, partial [Thermoleophilia bacterium]|nr:glycosyltransferase [Thermoleophilia bacterium]
RRAELVCRVAASLPGGNLVNPELENFLLEHGKRITANAKSWDWGDCPPPTGLPGTKSILHVATTVYGSGGHSRVIGSWIELDRDSHHSLALTDQDRAVPGWLEGVVAESGGSVVDLRRFGGFADRAAALSSLAGAGFDVVVVHHHPWDVVPLLAFAGPSPPIAVFDHADHLFWVGAAVCDLLVVLRSHAERYGRIARQARECLEVPLPVSERFFTHPSRSEGRRRIGVDASTPVLVSIGSEPKYLPNQSQDFFASCSKLLERLPSAHVFVVGVPPSSQVVPSERRHDRLHLLGRVDDPGEYLAAADLFLDPFPGGAVVACLEACLSGVVPIMSPYRESELFLFDDPCITESIEPPSDEADWVEQAVGLIQDDERRGLIAREIQARVRSRHSSEEWGRCAEEVYAAAQAAGHKPDGLAGEGDPAFIVDHAWIGSSRFCVWGVNSMRSLLLTHGSRYGVRDRAAILVKALRMGELRIGKGDFTLLARKLLDFFRKRG